LAEMIRRMIEKGLLDRERTETDQRANAVRIAPGGRKALRSARSASERVERALLSGLSSTDRTKFVRMLTTVVSQAETNSVDSGNDRRRPRRAR
jgi:DNA-binding MarR family transcriptional regulator